MYSYIQYFNALVYFFSCLYELCFQLAIIMLAKQLIQVQLQCHSTVLRINAMCFALCDSFEFCCVICAIFLFVQNTLMEVVLPLLIPQVKRLFQLCFKKKPADANAQQNAAATPGSSSIVSTECPRCVSPLERDFKLDTVTYNSLFGEYLEMGSHHCSAAVYYI